MTTTKKPKIPLKPGKSKRLTTKRLRLRKPGEASAEEESDADDEAIVEEEDEQAAEVPEVEEELAPATDEDLSNAVQDFADERSEVGVLLGESITEVSASDAVVTVIFEPEQAGVDLGTSLSVTPYDNYADFASVPFVWTTPESTNLRERLTRVDTQLANGESLGSLTVEEIVELHDLPE